MKMNESRIHIDVTLNKNVCKGSKNVLIIESITREK